MGDIKEPIPIGTIIQNITDYIVLYSNIPQNGRIDFDRLSQLIRAEIESNPQFDNNVQHMCFTRQDYISVDVAPNLNELQRHVLCIVMVTVCNVITLNLINDRVCSPVFKVGSMCLLDFLIERRSIEIDVLNNVLDNINDNFIGIISNIIINSNLSVIPSLIYASFYDNHDILLYKLSNLHNYIQPAVNIIQNELINDDNIYIMNNIGIINENIDNHIFSTFFSIYLEIIEYESLTEYDDEHPRNSQRYETLLVIKNYLLNNGTIFEHNFSQERIIDLLNMYHGEIFNTIEEYQNAF